MEAQTAGNMSICATAGGLQARKTVRAETIGDSAFANGVVVIIHSFHRDQQMDVPRPEIRADEGARISVWACIQYLCAATSACLSRHALA